MLSRESLGATELVVTLKSRGGGERPIRLRTSAPVWQTQTLRELARGHLERVRLDAPIVGVRIAVTETALAKHESEMLLGARARDEAGREVALGRLRARFGDAAVKRAERREVGPPLERARYRSDGLPRERLDAPNASSVLDIATPCLPWRRLPNPVRVDDGAVFLAEKRRRIVRLGRVERTTPPWWDTGTKHVELFAWAELEGHVLALLRARVSADAGDEWEAIAWVD
jgi:hypothetical protein